MKKITILIATILVFALTMSTFADSFSDVPENHWAYEAIVELYNLGIYEGYPDGTFKGDNALTRYEMAMVITRTLQNINEQRQETLSMIEAYEEELSDLQMSLEGTQQLVNLHRSVNEKEIEQINADLETTLDKLENLEAIQEELDDLGMSLEGTKQLVDLHRSVSQKEIDGLKEDVDEIDTIKDQVAAIEEKLGDQADVDTIASIEEKIESVRKSGLNTEQAQDVTAIVRAMLKENDLDQADVATEDTIENLQALIEEFEEELDEIDMSLEGTSQLADLRYSIMDKRVSELEEKVAVLEEPVITFSGEYGVDFSRVNVDGDRLLTEDMKDVEANGFDPVEGYYFKDPYNVESGSFVEQEETDNDDGSPDYRLTDEEDYYEDELSFTNTLDLNIGVNKGILSADLNMVAFENSFGGDDTVGYELDSLEGTITADEFKATIKDGQEVTFKDYLYDESSVDGVVVEYKDGVYFLSRTTETVEESAYDLAVDNGMLETDAAADYIVEGADDEVATYDRTWLRAGTKTSIDLVLPINVYTGFEYSDEIDTDWEDVEDGGGDPIAVTEDEVKTMLVGLDTSTEMAGFDITSDLAFNLGESSDNGHLFRLGAEGDLAMLGVEFNYENTKDMNLIENSADETKKGYDLTLDSTLGPVTGSWTREDYGTVSNTIKAEVAEGEVTFAGIDVDGSYELTIDENDARKEIRNINASTDLAGIAVDYTYDYDADNELYDEEKDRVDNGVADDPEEEDADVNSHTIEGTYGMGAFTLGATAEMAKDIVDDDVDIVWGDFENTYTITGDYASGPITAGVEHVVGDTTTLTGRYTQEMYEAGFEKVLNGDLTIDGSVTAPTLTLVGVDIDSNACFKRNINQNTQNLEFNVDAAKDVSDKLALTAGATWADKEIDVDFNGQKTVLGAGAEYTITDDIAATADYKRMSFDADSGESYNVSEATAGVSIAF